MPVGKKGQVLCHFHDSDELVIIADSFEGYLQILIDESFDFITEDNIDEWEQPEG
ncbi:MAG: SMI1/KNR4 family protein [Lachnospiraceae bacterium]|nr:SMI1/KNR4 family protein [Lachnospiraceae bacterium]